VIIWSESLLPAKTQQIQATNVHEFGRIRTPYPGNKKDANLFLRPQGFWHRPDRATATAYSNFNYCGIFLGRILQCLGVTEENVIVHSMLGLWFNKKFRNPPPSRSNMLGNYLLDGHTCASMGHLIPFIIISVLNKNGTLLCIYVLSRMMTEFGVFLDKHFIHLQHHK
jgi:hypothetical protein